MSPNARRLHLAMLMAAGVWLVYSPLAGLSAQQAPGAAASSTPRMLNEPDDPRLKGFRWRSIGPTAQGGRIRAKRAAE